MIDAVYGVLTDIDAEVIVVDDDSPDGTSEVVDRILNRYRKLRLITRRSNKGLVNSIKEGIKSSRGSICLWMDADLSMPTDKIPDLVNKIKEGADLAVGSRYIKGGGIKGSAQGVLFWPWLAPPGLLYHRSQTRQELLCFGGLGRLPVRLFLDQGFQRREVAHIVESLARAFP